MRSGEAIGAGSKLYGFRVDNVHNETYRLLNGMSRGGVSNIEEIEIIDGSDNEGDPKKDVNAENN